MLLISLVVVVIMALVHVLGEIFSEHIERFHIELRSFGAGLMVGTFFLEILPQLAVGETYLSSFIYLPFLGGFVLIHVLEKLVYQHAIGDAEMAKDVARFEALALAAYELLVGIIVVVFFATYGDVASLIIAPFFVRTFALSVFSRHVSEKIGSVLNRVISAVAPIVGVLIGFLLIENKTQLYLVFSVTMGVILYVVIRDMIPTGREGTPIYFVLGALMSMVISLIV
jgi:hypothetical protein